MGKTNLIIKSMLCMTLILFPSNVQSASREALLYVFEDNEAVIKMIVKGRSPTMRHVSRTHRVALDWLFDRINLDPKIQIKYIDTMNQLADILTKGNFTRDEWNHLLTLFNISHFSSTACIAAMGETSSTRIRRRTCHSQITTYDEFDRKNAFVRVFFSFIKPGRGPRMDIKILKDLFLTIERGNLWKRQDQIIYKRIMVYPGLLKSGKLEMENTIDQGNLIKILGIHWEKLTLIVENIFSAGRRILQGTKRLFTIERGNPLQRMSKERLILKISSWEVRQQNLSIKSETKCELDKNGCQALQRIVPNIQ